MKHNHAIVWIDHHEAKIFFVEAHEVEKIKVLPEHPHSKVHLGGSADKGKKLKEDQHYYHHVVEAVKDAAEILIVGPAQAKLELMKHISGHDAKVLNKVVGVESVDHPSDGQIIKYARDYFKVADRMFSQVS